MSDLERFGSDLPTETHLRNLTLPPAGSEYVAMSLVPREFGPDTKDPKNITVGYAGVMVDNGQLRAIAQLANDSTETAFRILHRWLKPGANAHLPESTDYRDELLDKIVSSIPGQEPLALIRLDRVTERDYRFILAAQTMLGAVALDHKEASRLTSSSKRRTLFQRLPKRKDLTEREREAFGTTNYEAIIVGGALMRKLFATPPPFSALEL